MSDLARWVERAVKAAGVPITSVSIGAETDKSTWTVSPLTLQASAQPIIDAFDPNDPAHVTADLNQQVIHTIDEERLISAVVWTVIDTYSAPATVAKYLNARTKIISAYKLRPWIP